MVSETSRRWIEAGTRVRNGERDGIICPQNTDYFLRVDWIPFDSDDGSNGEWWLHCPTCEAQNFSWSAVIHEYLPIWLASRVDTTTFLKNTLASGLVIDVR
jgi:hypothetical protein